MNQRNQIHGLVLALALIPAAASAADARAISGRVVDPDGKGVPQAVVFVEAPLPPAARASAESKAEMNQINRTFVPGVLPVVVGTLVNFPNSDQIHHHVYSFSRTKTFELPLYRGENAKPVLFDKPGVVKIGCNIHDWMSGIILVLPSAWYAVTDAQGRYALPGLPAGEYTLVAWHEQSRGKTADTEKRVRVADGDATANFDLALTAATKRPDRHGARTDP
ncbi:MAG: carboxypeptidase regulatory-like domain-containing protein [Steroidobacteraceae bacterium]